MPQIIVVGPGGACVGADKSGMVFVPRSWRGKMLLVRDGISGRSLTSFQIDSDSDEPQKLTMPKD
jgi:hypothetical protein